VADIITSRLEELKLKYPTLPESERAVLAQSRQQLEAEGDA
jgi:hypothetical protein